MAAAHLGIPILIHESDVVVGAANRVAARHALFVLTGFPKSYYAHEPFADKVIYTGIPVRDSLGGSPSHYLKTIRFDPKRKTILVMGGSQGAQRINQIVGKSLTRLLEDFQIIHLTGTQDLAHASFRRAQLSLYLRLRYHVAGFLKRDFPEVLAAADLVIARAGASTLAELAIAQKPAILMPLASAAAGHQLKNAEVFAQAGAAVILDDHQVTQAEFVATVKKLLSSEYRLKQMANKMSLLGKPDATEHSVKIILEVLGV
ncbi:hypothetical protein HY065_01640 [Candidatus Berkelbacteria bacterium]|nr:hypothetical protein [Candidatus Berkelbacteria bacterium]